MSNKYMDEALDNILEMLDGMTIDEIFEMIDAVENIANANEQEYFNYAEYALTHKKGDNNA